jgi:pimeloyl-ACP methyl ester carboxylesterase
MKQGAETVYQDALQQARKGHKEQAITDLESIAPYPPPDADARKMFITNKWAGELLGPPPGGPNFTNGARILTDLISAPEYSLADDYGFIQGMSFSRDVMLPEVMKVNLSKLGFDFRVPIFFFEGRHDPYCPPSLVWEYSQTIEAPQKEFIWFENSGHYPFFEEQQKFGDELFQRVLPLANDGQDDR